MPELNWDRVREGKDAYRDKLAELPFEEKLQLLERLRNRALVLGRQVQPMSGGQREPTSNLHICVVSPPDLRQVPNSTVGANLKCFGAAATLVAAMSSAESSAVGTSVLGSAVRQPR